MLLQMPEGEDLWKSAKLVLLKKPNKPDVPPSYRPICFFSEQANSFLKHVMWEIIGVPG